MIETFLYFLLGFLCAGLLALIIAPTVWRRAVRLTRKRVEASLPLSLDEIEAGKDSLRAEFAMTARRLEMATATAMDKSADQMIEIGRGRESLKGEQAAHGETAGRLEVEQAKTADLELQVAIRTEELRLMTEKEAATERQSIERAQELERMGGLYQEASYAASTRQIELVSRESDIERLNNDLSQARLARRDIEHGAREQGAELSKAREAASSEKRRADDREKKIERMLSTIADREELLSRRDKEVAELRGSLKDASQVEAENILRHGAIRDQNHLLEGRVAAMDKQLAVKPMETTETASAEAAKYAADRRRLEDRLTTVAKQNQKLRAELAALQLPTIAAAGSDQDTILREQIGAIAAQVVHLTQVLEGSDSPIDKALALSPSGGRQAEAKSDAKVVSLADRVRALQKTANRSTE